MQKDAVHTATRATMTRVQVAPVTDELPTRVVDKDSIGYYQQLCAGIMSLSCVVIIMCIFPAAFVLDMTAKLNTPVAMPVAEIDASRYACVPGAVRMSSNPLRCNCSGVRCLHGSFTWLPTCECSPCSWPFTGSRCHECALTHADCAPGAHLHHNECKCIKPDAANNNCPMWITDRLARCACTDIASCVASDFTAATAACDCALFTKFANVLTPTLQQLCNEGGDTVWREGACHATQSNAAFRPFAIVASVMFVVFLVAWVCYCML